MAAAVKRRGGGVEWEGETFLLYQLEAQEAAVFLFKKKKTDCEVRLLGIIPKVSDTCISSVAASSEVVGESFFVFFPFLPRVHCE